MEPTVTYCEDLGEGDESPPFVVENVGRIHFVRYAGASGDFNPMHHDDTVAAASGNPSVFGHGMFTAGLLGHLLSDWLGAENLRRFKVRFSERVWPGDTLTCRAKVVRKYEADGAGLVDVECSVENQNGKANIIGEATAAVARRAESAGATGARRAVAAERE